MIEAAMRNFDAIEYAKQLRMVGVGQEQADIHAQALEHIAEMAVVGAKYEVENKDLATRQEIKAMDTSIRQEIKDVEIAIRQDMKDMETAIRQDMKDMGTSIRQEMKEMDSSLRQEIKNLEVSTKQDMKVLELAIKDVEVKMEKLHNKTIIWLGVMLISSGFIQHYFR